MKSVTAMESFSESRLPHQPAAQTASLLVSPEITASRDDFLGARNLFRRNVRPDQALDNSATLFADQHSCGLKSALLRLRPRHVAKSPGQNLLKAPFVRQTSEVAHRFKG